ncbi:M12 family metallopeptidase [Rhizobium ruizarguesonis]|uniref:M12 family metallopeptidase n=1 Tax=Rhizobium ruizarguesonis TaxID=2081791 RepID=UPI001038611E|nr:M12 family metallopeptidase [Rhizobium ruizarguesonis]TBB32442.1 DUF1353 domain-containing protein [Rhizobium ruizarguesonis]
MTRFFLVLFAISISFGSAHAQTGSEQTPVPEEGTGTETDTITLTFNGVGHRISFYEGDEGEALFQGDIIMGPIEAVRNSNNVALQSLGSDILFGLAIRNKETRWPNGEVRYRINKNLPNPGRVQSAIAAWEAATPIRFKEIVTASGNFVDFVPGSGCSSAVGMVGGRQVVRLEEGCGVGNTIHEIGHALGLHHEQAREDRGEHIIVFGENIVAEAKGNFASDPTTYADVEDYCFGSIMHYGNFAFSKQPGVLKTIETVPPGQAIGQRVALAKCDVDTIKTIYGVASDAPTDPVFVGDLDLIPEHCKEQGKCFLKNEITFTDGRGVRWRAGKWIEGSQDSIETGTTDGASIPPWAQAIVGEPFNDEYLKAAVLHDHYCYKENHVRGWRETHRMFYDAMVALNVPALKAKVMYAAVYLGGPRWTRLVPGESCGPQCLYDTVKGLQNISEVENDFVVVRKDRYDEGSFKSQLDAVRLRLEADPTLSLTDIENIANKMNPDDIFSRAGKEHEIAGPADAILLP